MKTHDDENIKNAALLYVQEIEKGTKQLQQVVAKKMKTEQPRVSSWITKARERGYIVTSFEPNPHPRSAAELKIRLETLANKKGVRPLNELMVTGRTPINSPVDEVAAKDRFRKEAAVRIYEILRDAKNVGITWGGILQNLVRNMPEYKRKEAFTNQLRIIPLCGEPKTVPLLQSSSTILAGTLHEIIYGRKNDLSLHLVPAWLPKETPDAVKKYLQKMPGYQAIFENEIEGGIKTGPLAEKVDTLLTGVGSSSSPGAWLKEGFTGVGMTDENFADYYMGDIGGVLLERSKEDGNMPRLSTAAQKQIDDMRETWIGLKMEHIKMCAEKASNKLPGVVVFAYGPHKANAVYKCLTLGLINRLIIDESLARELLTLVNSKLKTPR